MKMELTDKECEHLYVTLRHLEMFIRSRDRKLLEKITDKLLGKNAKVVRKICGR